MIQVDEQTLFTLKKQYRQGMDFVEMENLNSMSRAKISQLLKPYFESGELFMRTRGRKKLDPNRQKKKYNYYIKTGIGIGGRNKERKKFNPEQEQQIIADYFDNDLSRGQLIKKWGIHPMTMQSLFAKVIESGEREPKKKGRKWYKEKENG